MDLNNICNDLSRDASQYINGELSLSEIKTYSEHLLKCKRCSSLITKEEKFETYLAESINEDFISNNINSKMEKLTHSIMTEIKKTPQKTNKIAVKQLETYTHHPELINNNKSNSSVLILAKPALAFLSSLSLVVLLILLIYTGPIGIKKNTKLALYKPHSKAVIQLKKYNNKRNLASLYGTPQNQAYNNYLSSFAVKINSFDSELKNTILHKINTTNFFKPPKKKTSITQKASDNFYTNLIKQTNPLSGEK